MDVSICPDENIITSTIPDSDDFEGIESLEDFSVGFGASRVAAQESCFIRKLEVTSLEEQANQLRNQESAPVSVDQAMELISIPAENVEDFGDRIAEFCGDLPAYKLGVSEDQNDEGSRGLKPMTDASGRIILLKFLKCTILFLIPCCTTTTLTFPTGISFTFSWFFFG